MSLSFTSVRGLCGIAVLCFAAALAGGLAASPPQEPKPVVFPANDVGVESLAARKAAQEKTAREWKVFHDFHFSDRVEESGITFVHRITDDSGKNYKANHYDHGTGIAVADVDGDGLADIYFVSQLGGNELWKNLGGQTPETWTGTENSTSSSPTSRRSGTPSIATWGPPSSRTSPGRAASALPRSTSPGSA